MPNAILIPAEVYGLGIVISLGIAILIKFMMNIIVKTTKSDSKDSKQG